MAINGVESTLPDPQYVRQLEELLRELQAQVARNTQDISNLNRG